MFEGIEGEMSQRAAPQTWDSGFEPERAAPVAYRVWAQHATIGACRIERSLLSYPRSVHTASSHPKAFPPPSSFEPPY